MAPTSLSENSSGENSYRMRSRIPAASTGFRDHAGAVNGRLHDFSGSFAEDELPVELACRNIAMNRRLPDAGEGGDRPVDQVFPGGGEHIDADAVGDESFADQAADKLELLAGRSRVGDFDFPESDPAEHFKVTDFRLDIHRLRECLVAVAQIDGDTERHGPDAPGRPDAVFDFDGLGGSIFRIFTHFHSPGLHSILRFGGASSERRENGKTDIFRGLNHGINAPIWLSPVPENGVASVFTQA